MSARDTGGLDRRWLLGLALVPLAVLAVFAWTSTHYLAGDGRPDTFVDETGHLHVLGITLGRTTLAEAERRLMSKSDVALYIYPREHRRAGLRLEAFFPSIADHTRVVLELAVDRDRLHRIEARATPPHLYPNGVARRNLAADDVQAVRQATVASLTLIPSTTLTAGDVEARFGRPDLRDELAGGGTRLVYRTLGLEARLPADGPGSLHFDDPGPRVP